MSATTHTIAIRKEWLEALALFLSTDETRYVLCGVNIERKNGELSLTATDGRQLASICTTQPGENFNVTVKDSLVHAAIRSLSSEVDELRLEWTDDGTVSITDHSLTVQGTLVEEAHRYPNWRQVVPQHTSLLSPHLMGLNVERLSRVLELAAKLEMAPEFRLAGAATDPFSSLFFEGRSRNCAVIVILMPLGRGAHGGIRFDWLATIASEAHTQTAISQPEPTTTP